MQVRWTQSMHFSVMTYVTTYRCRMAWIGVTE